MIGCCNRDFGFPLHGAPYTRETPTPMWQPLVNTSIVLTTLDFRTIGWLSPSSPRLLMISTAVLHGAIIYHLRAHLQRQLPLPRGWILPNASLLLLIGKDVPLWFGLTQSYWMVFPKLLGRSMFTSMPLGLPLPHQDNFRRSRLKPPSRLASVIWMSSLGMCSFGNADFGNITWRQAVDIALDPFGLSCEHGLDFAV